MVGGIYPLNCRKPREKNDISNQHDVLQVLSKSSPIILKTIFEILSDFGTYWSGGTIEIHDFRGFLRIFQRVFEISSGNLFL